MRRFFARWIVRAAVLALFGSLFIVQGWFGALVGWAVFAYLLVRAFPAVRQDFRALWRAGSRISINQNARF